MTYYKKVMINLSDMLSFSWRYERLSVHGQTTSRRGSTFPQNNSFRHKEMGAEQVRIKIIRLH